MSFFQNASNFNIGSMTVKNVAGDYIDNSQRNVRNTFSGHDTHNVYYNNTSTTTSNIHHGNLFSGGNHYNGPTTTIGHVSNANLGANYGNMQQNVNSGTGASSQSPPSSQSTPPGGHWGSGFQPQQQGSQGPQGNGYPTHPGLGQFTASAPAVPQYSQQHQHQQPQAYGPQFTASQQQQYFHPNQQQWQQEQAVASQPSPMQHRHSEPARPEAQQSAVQNQAPGGIPSAFPPTSGHKATTGTNANTKKQNEKKGYNKDSVSSDEEDGGSIEEEHDIPSIPSSEKGKEKEKAVVQTQPANMPTVAVSSGTPSPTPYAPPSPPRPVQASEPQSVASVATTSPSSLKAPAKTRPESISGRPSTSSSVHSGVPSQAASPTPGGDPGLTEALANLHIGTASQLSVPEEGQKKKKKKRDVIKSFFSPKKTHD